MPARPAAARSALEKTQRQLQKHPHRFRSVDMVTSYQRLARFQLFESDQGAEPVIHRLFQLLLARGSVPLSEQRGAREETGFSD